MCQQPSKKTSFAGSFFHLVQTQAFVCTKKKRRACGCRPKRGVGLTIFNPLITRRSRHRCNISSDINRRQIHDPSLSNAPPPGGNSAYSDGKPATDSEAIRPPIPTEVGHPFRSKPATLLRPA